MPHLRTARKDETPDEEDAFKTGLIEHTPLRWHMAVILLGVVLSGIVADKGLYRLGVNVLLVRYLLSVSASYLAFFALVRLWCALVFRRKARGSETASRPGPRLNLDLVSGNGLPGLESGNASSGAEVFAGRGGSFGGAGSSGTWGGSLPRRHRDRGPRSRRPPGGGVGGIPAPLLRRCFVSR